jgi:hypothetical protein
MPHTQFHSKFRLFSGPLGPDGSLGALAAEVEAFAAKAKAAPKSIGVEYLEPDKRVVLSLGYRDDEPGYAIKLTSMSLGKIENFRPEEIARLETKMGEAAGKLKDILCHELMVTAENEFVMVFMTKA